VNLFRATVKLLSYVDSPGGSTTAQ